MLRAVFDVVFLLLVGLALFDFFNNASRPRPPRFRP